MRHGGDQVFAGTGHPRADRADRAFTDLSRLGVRQAEHLGDHERLTPLVAQAGEQIGEGLLLLETRAAVRVGGIGGDHPVGDAYDPGPAGDVPDVVGGGLLVAVLRAQVRPQDANGSREPGRPRPKRWVAGLFAGFLLGAGGAGGERFPFVL